MKEGKQHRKIAEKDKNRYGISRCNKLLPTMIIDSCDKNSFHGNNTLLPIIIITLMTLIKIIIITTMIIMISIIMIIIIVIITMGNSNYDNKNFSSNLHIH